MVTAQGRGRPEAGGVGFAERELWRAESLVFSVLGFLYVINDVAEYGTGWLRFVWTNQRFSERSRLTRRKSILCYR